MFMPCDVQRVPKPKLSTYRLPYNIQQVVGIPPATEFTLSSTGGHLESAIDTLLGHPHIIIIVDRKLKTPKARAARDDCQDGLISDLTAVG